MSFTLYLENRFRIIKNRWFSPDPTRQTSGDKHVKFLIAGALRPRGVALIYLATWRYFLSLERRWNNGTLIPVNFGRSGVIRASSVARRVKSGAAAARKFTFSPKYLSPVSRKSCRRPLSLFLFISILVSFLFVIARLLQAAINVPRNEVLLALTNARKLRTYASHTLSFLISRTSTYSCHVSFFFSLSLCLSLSFSFFFVWQWVNILGIAES